MSRKPRSAGIDKEKQMRFDLEFARKMLVERGQVRPMFIVYGEKGISPVGATWEDDEQKLRVYKMVQLIAHAQNANAITYVGEAWAAKVRPEDQSDPMNPAVRARDREDRVEIVVIAHCWRDDGGTKNTWVMQPEIERRANGRASGLKGAEILGQDSSMEWVSPLADCLPDAPVPEHVQQSAKQALDAFNAVYRPH